MNKNKHGLSRYIPAEIQRKIRKECGFGCVLCGEMLCQYEHISPTFSKAEKHDHKKMALLCTSCHDKVTRGLISKTEIIKARQSPWALNNGHAHSLLHHNETVDTFIMGGNTFIKPKTIFTRFGIPLIWFENPGTDGHRTFNAIIPEKNGSVGLVILNNMIIFRSNGTDVVIKKSNITLKTANKQFVSFDREGDAPLSISKLDMDLFGDHIHIDENGFEGNFAGGGKITLRGSSFSNCAEIISSGEKKFITYQMIDPLIYAAAKQYHSSNGQYIGMVTPTGEVFNKDNLQCAVIRHGRVYDLRGFHIADYTKDGFIKCEFTGSFCNLFTPPAEQVRRKIAHQRNINAAENVFVTSSFSTPTEETI